MTTSTAPSSGRLAAAFLDELENEAKVTRTCLERVPADIRRDGGVADYVKLPLRLQSTRRDQAGQRHRYHDARTHMVSSVCLILSVS